MKIAVIGVGAVGGVVAWHLARAGLEPVLVGRRATVDRLNADGLTLADAAGSETVRVAAYHDPAAVGACDAVLTGFKAHEWVEALPTVRSLIGPDTAVVPMLNGIPWWYFHRLPGPYTGRPVTAVDPDGTLARAIPLDQVLGCVVYMGGKRVTPAHVRWNGRRRLVVGEPGGAASPRLTRLVSLLQQSGLDAIASDDIRREVWAKLLGNTTYNPMSVITGATIGELADDAGLAMIIRRIMEEMMAVARAIGVKGDFDLDERQRVAPAMRAFKTSMLQDFEAGRPLELAAIVEAVVELGRLAGVATPTIETIGRLAAYRSRAARART